MSISAFARGPLTDKTRSQMSLKLLDQHVYDQQQQQHVLLPVAAGLLLTPLLLGLLHMLFLPNTFPISLPA